MENLDFTAILGVIATALILPLIADGIKRNWDYKSSSQKAKTDILTELNDLLWKYHTECANMYGLTYPPVIKNKSDKEIKKEIEGQRQVYLAAAANLYNGLFAYQSKIQQYYDNCAEIDGKINDLLQWVFHDENPMDDRFLILSQGENFRDLKFREQLDQDFLKFQNSANLILRLLSRELREASYFWYPIKKLFIKRADYRQPSRRK
jgi:hypothetical protein